MAKLTDTECKQFTDYPGKIRKHLLLAKVHDVSALQEKIVFKKSPHLPVFLFVYDVSSYHFHKRSSYHKAILYIAFCILNDTNKDYLNLLF